ncbi:hypothetical protein GCK32_014456 [Trichostrongylus colubriformis]|uniref:Amino acid transporter transmembrane domain-containing protein n=1 Tax=Trichostrongylus colubriformis TaxID=6319 RepID=A0AAN8G9Z6_TRICO
MATDAEQESATARHGSNAVIANADAESINDARALVPPPTRSGDVISPTRAVLTLSKSMFNAGCFSLPYAWKLGGLWVSDIVFSLQSLSRISRSKYA